MAWRKPANLREWLRLVGAHKKKFIFPFLTAMIVVMAASFFFPREYRAEAKFQRISETTLENTGARAIANNLAPYRRTVVDDIKGKSAISQLIEDLGLTRDLPHTGDGALTPQGELLKGDMIADFQKRLQVRFTTQSDQIDLISVTYVDPRSDMAPKVVNRLVENYLRETRRRLDETLLNAKVFFEREVDRYRATTQELERKKLQFEMENAGMLPDDPTNVKNKMIEVEAELQRVSKDLEVAKAQRNRLEELIKTMPEVIVEKQSVQNPILQKYIEQRTEMEKQMDQHINFFGRKKEHPLVQKLQKQMDELDKKIADTTPMLDAPGMERPNTERQAAIRESEVLAGTITALTGRREELLAQLDKWQIIDRNFFAIRNEYEKLKRDLDDGLEQLKFWSNNLQRTTIALKAELGARGVRLMFTQQADIARPSSPTVPGILAVAVFAGLAAGGLMIVLAELLDHSLRSIDQAVDEIKLPVLGAVTEIVTPGEAIRRRFFGWTVYPILGASMVLVLMVSAWLVYLNLEEPQTFRKLVTNPKGYVGDIVLRRT